MTQYETMKYTIIIERGPTSYGAYIPDLPGCVAAGDTREEAISLITEAVNDHVELMLEHGETVPEPTVSAIEVEFSIPAIAGTGELTQKHKMRTTNRI